MKQLTCEMCGSADLMKQDGVFVCQTCGCKYSIEEAKKMMVEGTVDVSGSTMKVDTTGELSNLYQIARRAKDTYNDEDAARYYDMILIKDPTSWEAAFYVVYFKARICKIGEISSAAHSISNCLDSVFDLIKNHINDKDEQIAAVKEVSESCISIASLLFSAALNHYKGIDVQIRQQYHKEMSDRCISAHYIDSNLGDKIEEHFGDYEELHPVAVSAWKAAIRISIIPLGVGDMTFNMADPALVKQIQKYEPTYVAPQSASKVVQGSSGGGCYIATAVYGSYDCPQVWTLRRYRDYTLAETWYGRTFIRTYYAVSPTLVKWFGNAQWFKKLWKGKLDRIVERLQNSGVKGTPYEDRRW